MEGHDTVAGGVISMEGLPDQRRAVEIKSTNVISVEHRLTAGSRAVRNGHHGGVLWFTGLSGAGKSTRSEEHTSELQSLMRMSYAVLCLKKQTTTSTSLGYTH